MFKIKLKRAVIKGLVAKYEQENPPPPPPQPFQPPVASLTANAPASANPEPPRETSAAPLVVQDPGSTTSASSDLSGNGGGRNNARQQLSTGPSAGAVEPTGPTVAGGKTQPNDALPADPTRSFPDSGEDADARNSGIHDGAELLAQPELESIATQTPQLTGVVSL